MRWLSEAVASISTASEGHRMEVVSECLDGAGMLGVCGILDKTGRFSWKTRLCVSLLRIAVLCVDCRIFLRLQLTSVQDEPILQHRRLTH